MIFQAHDPHHKLTPPLSRWTKAELESAKRELDTVNAAGHLRAQTSAVLQDLLANACRSKPDDREELWQEIEAAWPQLAEAMLSRLSEILWNDPEIRRSKQFPIPRENVLD